jgi:hypothetical protein
MPIHSRAEKAAQAVFAALDTEPAPAVSRQVVQIFENVMAESYREAAERCTTAAQRCCNEDRDLAHKIADEIERHRIALIANLSSLR